MNTKNTRTHASNLQRSAKRKIHSLLFNKKAASVVISTVILTAGVIAMSIAVLYWTYSMGKITNIEYEKNTAANSNAIEERIGYEHISGSNNNLTVYIINWGKADNIRIAHVLILDNSYRYVGSNMSNIRLKNIDNPSGTSYISGNHLRIGADGFFTTSLSTQLTPNMIYYVRIVTTRGRNFDGSFIAY
jgi:hypothetical protein